MADSYSKTLRFSARGAAGRGAVFDHDERLQHGDRRRDGGDARRKLAMVDQRDAVRVFEQVAQLVFDVAEVDVHGDGADLERAERSLDPLVAVVRVDADVVARADAARLQEVREAVRTLVELREREAAIAVHERLALRHVVGDALEEVGEIEMHHRFSLLTIHME